MKFSKRTDLAIHSLWYLAKYENDGPLLVSRIAKAQNVSVSYLEKIFQKLVKGGIIRSVRGKKGGFAIAKKPHDVTIYEIMKITEADEPIFECLRKERGCQVGECCELKDIFKSISSEMDEKLKSISIADLMKNGDKEPELVSWIAK